MSIESQIKLFITNVILNLRFKYFIMSLNKSVALWMVGSGSPKVDI